MRCIFCQLLHWSTTKMVAISIYGVSISAFFVKRVDLGVKKCFFSNFKKGFFLFFFTLLFICPNGLKLLFQKKRASRKPNLSSILVQERVKEDDGGLTSPIFVLQSQPHFLSLSLKSLGTSYHFHR